MASYLNLLEDKKAMELDRFMEQGHKFYPLSVLDRLKSRFQEANLSLKTNFDALRVLKGDK